MSRSNQQKPVPPQDTSKILVDSNGPKVEKQPLLLHLISLHATTQK
jgi:hypothetical protein